MPFAQCTWAAVLCELRSCGDAVSLKFTVAKLFLLCLMCSCLICALQLSNTGGGFTYTSSSTPPATDSFKYKVRGAMAVLLLDV